MKTREDMFKEEMEKKRKRKVAGQARIEPATVATRQAVSQRRYQARKGQERDMKGKEGNGF